MWTSVAVCFAAANHLFSQPDSGTVLRPYRTVPFELGAGEDQQTPQVMLVKISDRVEKIAVQRHCLTPLREVRTSVGQSVGRRGSSQGAESIDRRGLRTSRNRALRRRLDHQAR